MEKYQNKYRIPSARLQTWDYGNNGSYFITICTQNREHYFGEIVETMVETQCIASLRPTEIGKIVEQEWIKTPALRPDMNLELGNFVVMPNHFHGILIIGDNKYNAQSDSPRDAPRDDPRRDAMHGVSTTITTITTITTTHDIPANKFGPQSKNLASVIRGFKSSVTTNAKKMGIADFAWQSRFHEHIIRDAESFERIQNYVADNPKNWKDDKFYGK